MIFFHIIYELPNFKNFSEFQNFISDSLPSTSEHHYDALRTKIDMQLTPELLVLIGTES